MSQQMAARAGLYAAASPAFEDFDETYHQNEHQNEYNESISTQSSTKNNEKREREQREELIQDRISHPQTPRTMAENAREIPAIGGGSGNGNSSFSVWQIGYYAFLFDVSTRDVVARILQSLVPFPARLLPSISGLPTTADESTSPFLDAGSASGKANVSTDGNLTDSSLSNRYLRSSGGADLYGPFWIVTTLVAVLPALGNLSMMLSSWTQARDGWKYDDNLMPVAASLLYGYLAFAPLVLWAVLKWMSAGVRLFDLACVIGYSLFVLVPAALVSVIAPFIVGVGAFGLAAIISAANVVFNLHTVLTDTRFKPVLFGVGIVHMALIISVYIAILYV